MAGFLSSSSYVPSAINFLRSQATHACTKSYYLCGPPLYTLTHNPSIQTKCNGTAVLYGGMINKNRKSPLLCGVVHYDNVGYFVHLVLIFSFVYPSFLGCVGGLVSWSM